MNEHRFPYRWNLKDSNFTKDKGTVFSCFSCAGGSTMGYKLAGFDVIGNNEIEEKINKIYVENHNPKYSYTMDIRDLVKMAKEKELPEELYQLDVLDGSPPCTSFSTAGVREKYWGKEHFFREGQKKQVLDTLFFDFIDLSSILRPKIIIAENVKGILMGKAKKYVERISTELQKAGYIGKAYLLNSKDMGVPQSRERVFFIYIREDLVNEKFKTAGLFSEPILDLDFKEKEIKYKEIADDNEQDPLWDSYKKLWKNRIDGYKSLSDASLRMYGKENMFNCKYEYKNKVLHTIAGKSESNIPFHKPSFLSDNEVILGSSFPEDFNFLGSRVKYVCGMSVPPVMMANIATEVYNQWLSKI